MALTHAGTTLFGNNTHSDIQTGPYDHPLQIGQYTGLIGESHLIGRTKGRDLWCVADAYGYATEGQLENALTTIQSYANAPLFGTLRIIWPSNRFSDYAYTTFKGADKIGGGIKHNPLTNTYYSKILFRWRQAQ